MGFTEVTSLDADVTVALGKKDKNGKSYPKQAEGYFLGSRTVESKRGESKLHFLQTPKGNLGIWGTTDLNRKLGAVPVGTMVRVTSTGMKPTPNGDMYTYKVEVDKENCIELDAATTEPSNSAEGYSDTDNDSDDSRYDSSGDEDDSEDTAAVLAAQAERQAKVKALFSNKGKKA